MRLPEQLIRADWEAARGRCHFCNKKLTWTHRGSELVGAWSPLYLPNEAERQEHHISACLILCTGGSKPCFNKTQTLYAGTYSPTQEMLDLLSITNKMLPSVDSPARWGDAILRKLLELTYRISFLKEEGHYPRFSLYIPPRGEKNHQSSLEITFQRAIRLNMHSLRKLAPASPARPLALQVSLHKGEFVCKGFARIEQPCLSLDSSVKLIERELVRGLIITVHAPGELSLIESKGGGIQSTEIILRAGHAQLLQVLEHATLHQMWLEQVCASVTEEAPLRENLFFMLQMLWDEVLSLSKIQQRGAAFVILPTLKLTQQQERCLEFSHRNTERHLARLMTEVAFFSRERSGPSSKLNKQKETLMPVDRLASLEKSLMLQHKLLEHAHTLAKLSGVDGCVVLNHRLDLLGFGVKILVGDEQPLTIQQRSVDNQYIGKVSLGRFGMRHRSMARLCASLPNIQGYVVSQDGEIRIFASDKKKNVMMCGPFTTSRGLSAIF